MAQRENGKDAREEYRRVQARKKRQLEKQRHEESDREYLVQTEKYKGKSIRVDQAKSKARYQRRLERRKRKGSVLRGMVLLVLQIIAIVVFMAALFSLDMLTINYVAIAGCVLIVTAGVMLASQLSSKGKRIIGKAFSILITSVLVFSTYYIMKTNSVLANVTDNSGYKVEKMVVAVLKDDPAESISDAANYTFGVQYAKDISQTELVVQDINAETSSSIQTEEYPSVPAQAAALTDGKVDAIVYNESYLEMLKQSIDGFEDQVKIIYEHDIKTELKDLTIDVAVQDEPFCVYISGIDVYGELDTNSRSDVNILAVVNPKSHQVLLINTPRDYYVEIPGVSQGQPDKLTHAGIYGVDVSMGTLAELYDTEVPFYGRVNFTTMIDIINILGGVDVDSDIAFTTGADSEYIVDIEEGMNHLNGEEALAFCRERQAFLDGDNQRGKNQQKVITGLIKKMISPTMIVKASSILDTVSENVDTNMSTDQIRALIKQQLRENAGWRIASVSAEGSGAEMLCYSSGSTRLSVVVPDEQSVQEIKDMIDQVMDGETIEDSVVAEVK